VLSCSAAAIAAASAQEQATDLTSAPWSMTFSSDVRYFSWRSNRGTPPFAPERGSGSQLYTPYAVEIVGQPNDDWKVSALGRGGYVHSQQTTAGQAGEVNTITDTAASGTFTYLGLDGLQPFVSINLNLPTGRAALFGSSANARMDPDLVEIASFGEGLNIGPTVGFNLPVSKALMLTGSVGYTRRGSFDREADPVLPITSNLRPGEGLTVTGSIGYQSGQFASRITGTISQETPTKQDGIEVVRAGQRLLFAGVFAYAWPANWGETTLNASFAHSGRNKVRLPGASALVTEAFNANSNLYRVGVEHMFSAGLLEFGPIGSFLYRDNNGYDSTTLQFVPAKERWSAGAVARYAISETVTLNTRLEHVWIREGDRPAPDGVLFSVLLNDFVAAVPVPVISGTGWQAAIGLNVRF
jgi:hypothetical protein